MWAERLLEVRSGAGIPKRWANYLDDVVVFTRVWQSGRYRACS